jgi:hypothetical protein
MRALRGFVAVVACAMVGVLLLAPPALAAGTWTVTGSLNTIRVAHTATLLSGGKVLVAGGFLADTSLASAELYDPATGTWSTTGSMNAVRDFHTATLLETGKVLVAGGGGVDCCVNGLASAELYDPASGTWSTTGSMNTGRLSHTATLLQRGNVLVAGGIGPDGATLASAETYHPTTGVWKPVGPLNTARFAHTATLLASGQVLAAGGVDSGNNVLASAELFTPPTALELAPPLVDASTGIGPGKALANKATAIQTAVNAGQTAHACTRIKDYLALVKAQTGKKLTTQQANDLTTQATDLAAELDC